MNFKGILDGTNPNWQLKEVSREELMDIFYNAWISDRYKICKYDNRI